MIALIVAGFVYLSRSTNSPRFKDYAEFKELAKTRGFRITVRNDEKGNDVDKFFNGEVVRVNVGFDLPGTVELRFIKNENIEKTES